MAAEKQLTILIYIISLDLMSIKIKIIANIKISNYKIFSQNGA
jgi:hypothetical protein